MANARATFPLFEKARKAGILESGNGLIVAPTATGKSYIGRAILRRAAQRGEKGVHVYLVPYRALASEIYDSFVKEMSANATKVAVRVSTGDHTDPIYPGETDILIATYERFATLLHMPELTVGRVVVDEIHLLADETRGTVVEGILTRLKSHKRPASICALSAVVSNPEKLGEWLAIPLIIGESSDRVVDVEFKCEVTDDVESKLEEEVLKVLEGGDQAVVFCRSKPASQRVARDMRARIAKYVTEEDTRKINAVVMQVAEDDEDAKELLGLLAGGMAFHHAGLSRESRVAVESAFREGCLKAIACTPTLAAGVNLPARLVVVRDVYRTEIVRGFHQQVMLSTGELLNMLGRAGRPGCVDCGLGIALIDKKGIDKSDLKALQVAIRDGRGNPVSSRLEDSFDAFMRFLLSVVADKGECTLADLVAVVRQTLSFHENPVEISFDRSFDEDIMEDIPSYARVTPDMRVDRVTAVADGVAGRVVSGSNAYNFSLRFSGEDCTCPARAQWRRREVCKHLACAIHRLLFDEDVDPEIRTRAIYAATHRFRKTLDLGTKMKEAIRILQDWSLLEHVPGGFRATSVGSLASASGFDLLLFRTAADRIRKCRRVPTEKGVATWLVEDYFADEARRDKWLGAIVPWLDEVAPDKFALPEKYRGDFERGLDQLGMLATLYAEIAAGLGKQDVAEVCRVTRGCLQYGVKADLIPLAALRIPQMGRARCRFLYDSKGIHDLKDLSKADPTSISGPHAPLAQAKRWVETARSMMMARGQILECSDDKRNRAVDDFLTKFRVDQLTLFGDAGMMGGNS